MKYAKGPSESSFDQGHFCSWLAARSSEGLCDVMRTLWHRKIDTTLACYAKGFDESDATVRIEEWLDKRKR